MARSGRASSSSSRGCPSWGGRARRGRRIGAVPHSRATGGRAPDPFETVWPEILRWLPEDPDASAKSLLGRLDQKYPGQFPQGQLRTLQRRVRDWRRVLARNLVQGCQEGQATAETPMAIGAQANA